MRGGACSRVNRGDRGLQGRTEVALAEASLEYAVEEVEAVAVATDAERRGRQLKLLTRKNCPLRGQ